jgi:uncharacterized membrane protein
LLTSLWLPGILFKSLNSDFQALYFPQTLLGFLISCLSLSTLHSWRVMTITSNLKNLSTLFLSLCPIHSRQSIYTCSSFLQHSQSGFLPIRQALLGLDALFSDLGRTFLLKSNGSQSPTKIFLTFSYSSPNCLFVISIFWNSDYFKNMCIYCSYFNHIPTILKMFIYIVEL